MIYLVCTSSLHFIHSLFDQFSYNKVALRPLTHSRGIRRKEFRTSHGVFGGKASIAEASRVELSSSSSEGEGYDSGDEVDFNDEPILLDPSKFSHISEEEIYGCDPVTASPPAAVASAEGTLFAVLLT